MLPGNEESNIGGVSAYEVTNGASDPSPKFDGSPMDNINVAINFIDSGQGSPDDYEGGSDELKIECPDELMQQPSTEEGVGVDIERELDQLDQMLTEFGFT